MDSIFWYSLLSFAVGFLVGKALPSKNSNDDYLPIAAHQLRGPLTKLRWIFEMLKNDPTDLGLISKGEIISSDALTIVNDLFNNEFAQNGKFKYNFTQNDFGQLLKRVVADLEISAKKKNVGIKISTLGNIKPFIFDSHKIGIAIGNIIDNAIRYSKENGLIDINSHFDGKYLVTEVTDNGIGIPESDKSKIFQKFFRARNAKDFSDGSGLGLYISKQIVKDHKGEVKIESKEGQYTKVTIKIPTIGD